MPEEPKHPVEDLIEAHALQRRAEGGSFELHPATRELLRGEALRVHGKKPPEPAPDPVEPPVTQSAWYLLWTRLVGAFAVIGLLGLAVVVVQQLTPSPKMELAQNRPAAASELNTAKRQLADSSVVSQPIGTDAIPADSPLPAAAPTSTPEPVALSAARSQPASQPAEVPSEAPPRAIGLARTSEAESKTVPTRSAPAPKPATREMAVAKAKPEPVSAAPTFVDAISGASFRRVEVPDGLRRNMQSPALPEVLNQFTVSLLGNRLRLEEPDGSVYLGDLAVDGATFSVTGTNRTSGQLVRFSGRATLATSRSTADRKLAEQRSAAGQSGTMMPAVLEGTVALGDRQQWRLRAEVRP